MFCVSDATSAVLDVVEEVASVAELVSSSDPLETDELSVTELDGADSPLDTLESVVLANVDSSLDGVEDTELSAAELEANES